MDRRQPRAQTIWSALNETIAGATEAYDLRLNLNKKDAVCKSRIRAEKTFVNWSAPGRCVRTYLHTPKYLPSVRDITKMHVSVLFFAISKPCFGPFSHLLKDERLFRKQRTGRNGVINNTNRTVPVISHSPSRTPQHDLFHEE
jgi:hypothetical protein